MLQHAGEVEHTERNEAFVDVIKHFTTNPADWSGAPGAAGELPEANEEPGHEEGAKLEVFHSAFVW